MLLAAATVDAQHGLGLGRVRDEVRALDERLRGEGAACADGPTGRSRQVETLGGGGASGAVGECGAVGDINSIEEIWGVAVVSHDPSLPVLDTARTRLRTRVEYSTYAPF